MPFYGGAPAATLSSLSGSYSGPGSVSAGLLSAIIGVSNQNPFFGAGVDGSLTLGANTTLASQKW